VVEPPTVWSDRTAREVSRFGPRYERPGGRHDAGGKQGASSRRRRQRSRDRRYGGSRTSLNRPAQHRRRRLTANRDGPQPDQLRRDAKGCYDAVARLADMDLNHVEASLCFPQMSRFCGQEFSEAKGKGPSVWPASAALQRLDGGGGAPRIRPGSFHSSWFPLWGRECAAEIRRNAERGEHAVHVQRTPTSSAFRASTPGKWEPFPSACAETDTTSTCTSGRSPRMETVSPDAVPRSAPPWRPNKASGR